MHAIICPHAREASWVPMTLCSMRCRQIFDAEYSLSPQALGFVFNMLIEPYLNELVGNGRGGIPHLRGTEEPTLSPLNYYPATTPLD